MSVDAADPVPPPAKKRKKRRRSGDAVPSGSSDAAASESSDAASGQASPRVEASPAFARHFPDDPELARLVEAFERGNYALVREEAPRLARATTRDDVRRAARELRRRIDPDPTAAYLLAVAALLLAFLAVWYWTHIHGGA